MTVKCYNATMQKTFILNRKGQKLSVLIEESNPQLGLVFIMHGLGAVSYTHLTDYNLIDGTALRLMAASRGTVRQSFSPKALDVYKRQIYA